MSRSPSDPFGSIEFIDPSDRDEPEVGQPGQGRDVVGDGRDDGPVDLWRGRYLSRRARRVGSVAGLGAAAAGALWFGARNLSHEDPQEPQCVERSVDALPGSLRDQWRQGPGSARARAAGYSAAAAADDRPERIVKRFTAPGEHATALAALVEIGARRQGVGIERLTRAAQSLGASPEELVVEQVAVAGCRKAKKDQDDLRMYAAEQVGDLADRRAALAAADAVVEQAGGPKASPSVRAAAAESLYNQAVRVPLPRFGPENPIQRLDWRTVMTRSAGVDVDERTYLAARRIAAALPRGNFEGDHLGEWLDVAALAGGLVTGRDADALRRDATERIDRMARGSGIDALAREPRKAELLAASGDIDGALRIFDRDRQAFAAAADRMLLLACSAAVDARSGKVLRPELPGRVLDKVERSKETLVDPVFGAPAPSQGLREVAAAFAASLDHKEIGDRAQPWVAFVDAYRSPVRQERLVPPVRTRSATSGFAR